MNTSPPDPTVPTLRQRAEEELRDTASENLAALTPDEVRRRVHDLRVHQIELEMQNEELRRTQQELETSRARYFDLYDLAPVGYLTLDADARILETNVTAARLLQTTVLALTGRPFTRFILPEDQDVFYHCRRQLDASGQPRTCELRLRQPDGVACWTRLDCAVAAGDTPGTRVCRATLTDLTERKQAEAALRQSEQRLQADLEAMRMLRAVGALYLSETNLQPALDAVVEAAITLTGADMGNLQLLDPATGALRIRAQRGFDAAWVDFWDRAYTGKGACGLALERGQRVTVEDVTTDPLFVGTPALAVQLRAGVRAVQSTPLTDRTGQLLGMFSTHFRTPHRPDERSLRWLDLLARQTADMIEHAQAREQVRRLSREILAAREQERKQVSAALHHDVGSLAVGLAAHLDAVEADLRAGKSAEARRWLKRTRRVFGEAAAHLRQLAIQLRPPELDVIGLRAALRQHFAHLTRRRKLRIRFRDALGRQMVTGDTATVLFRVAQEAVTNALTHGHAKQVDIALDATDTEVILTVRDRGAGFDPAAVTPRAATGLGLRVSRELAASVGGAFTVESRPGRGTTVRARLPLAPAASLAGQPAARVPTPPRGRKTLAPKAGARARKRRAA